MQELLGRTIAYDSIVVPRPPTRWAYRSEGQTSVVWSDIHVRPRARVRLDSFRLVGMATTLELNWTATSTEVSGVAEGSTRLRTSSDVVPLGEALAR